MFMPNVLFVDGWVSVLAKGEIHGCEGGREEDHDEG